MPLRRNPTVEHASHVRQRDVLLVHFHLAERWGWIRNPQAHGGKRVTRGHLVAVPIIRGEDALLIEATSTAKEWQRDATWLVVDPEHGPPKRTFYIFKRRYIRRLPEESHRGLPSTDRIPDVLKPAFEVACLACADAGFQRLLGLYHQDEPHGPA